jgi:ribose transport system substrate-binding protein
MIKRSTRSAAGPAVLLAAASLLAACGAAGGGGGGSSHSSASTVPPKAGCGSFASLAPKDPDGALSSLPSEQRNALGRYPLIRASAWKNWKPDHKPPYSIGIAAAGGVDPLQTTLFREIPRLLKQSPLVGSVNFYSTGTSLDVPLQLQLYSQAVQKKPDIMIAEPLQPQAFLRAETAAGRAGIPTVNFLGDVESPYALNVNSNFDLTGALIASSVVRSIGGRGNVLFVHGYPGTTADDGMFKALKDVIARCPGVKLTGDVVGAFVNSAAKQEILKFISTHPAPLDGVVQAGGMGAGVISAFTSTGRKVPVIGDGSAVQGSLAYWRQHKGSYRAIGTAQPAHLAATAVVDVVLRTLEGQGPEINTFLAAPRLITSDNLDQWIDTSASTSSEIPAEGPKDSWLGDRYLDGLFVNGKTPR